MPTEARSNPSPGYLAPQFDRRKERLRLPPCQTCRTAVPVAVVSRTDYVLYLRCSGCGGVRSVPKPGVRQLGS
jgi:flavoprotein